MADADPTAMANAPIDDCWNRIGVRGDHSCALLLRHAHCRNCEIYASSAAELLDRIAVDGDDAFVGERAPPAAESVPAAHIAGDPFLLFRVHTDWFALPASCVIQVADVGPVHSLPRLRSPAVRGLANFGGQLLLCVELASLLGLSVSRAAVPARGRFVVARPPWPARAQRPVRGDETTVFPVDEVHGIERFGVAQQRALPATGPRAATAHTRSVLDWRGHSVGVLDASQLFETLKGALQ